MGLDEVWLVILCADDANWVERVYASEQSAKEYALRMVPKLFTGHWYEITREELYA